jgi:hypothetical protein
MAKYFKTSELDVMNQAREQIFAIRTSIYRQFKIDILDTDALSALSIYQIVSQYDPDYNVNFARNGEDAKSLGVLIENKATRVAGPLTATGKPRKGAGTDAAFQFHAMGDLDHARYIFVARNKEDLSVMRIYDISTKENRQVVLDHLIGERNNWLSRSAGNQAKMKRDIILLPEKTILEKLSFTSKTVIDNCQVFKD